ncbi:FPGT guanylyltransferase, partial [Amia calva]|nr:FPGT guanylyltransferase [Amia calva]
MNELQKRWKLSLQKSTRQKLEKFDRLRGKRVQDGEFWDVAIITAVDETQKAAYEMQITDKLHRGELPLGVPFHVFADPPGPKIGNGGSTLHSLEQVKDMYGEKLSGFRIIIIHAGGFSQRLPSASALGKIFTALPLGDPLYQMLELKLAMYIDFPSHMRPGVLVTCADDIELYAIKENAAIVFDRPGFSALAHPSPLSIGRTHGVFVLEPAAESDLPELEYRSCHCFLHKPSVDKMQASGAVCSGVSCAEYSSSCVSGSEFVYTDSTYYIDYHTATRLLALLKEIGPLDCEIDAYGDFLQALGPGATPAYTKHTANVTKEEKNLVNVREQIFSLLKGTPLNVVVLNNSKFYHVGTTQEYLFHLTGDPDLRAELGLLSDAFSICPGDTSKDSAVCVIHSLLHPSCAVASGSVIEYSRLGPNVTVGGNTIISGCWIDGGLSVPSNAFIHSLTGSLNGDTVFVTIMLGIEDKVKKSVSSVSDISQLQFFGTSLVTCLGCWGLSVGDLKFSGDQSCLSLWNARVFPLCSDLQSSFATSLQMINSLHSESSCSLLQDFKLFSLQEALKYKDLDKMLRFRKGLFEDICKEKSKAN